ncbi:XRE family transcriptional regulator [Streptomyces sp. LP11]|uniref:XRE family transcriptional regulator n=1 Tax=Streptomyces pyxinicus TaxID=2970331 RepID=A0ABT2B2E9_9ACTN|nr:XRE family transcriptional regulator [Streptomyces sp. LP11]MCS0602669.1 XRE family transcriptional regulator [Streptomyces sp. LP11]
MPRNLLERADMQAAFAAHDFGTVFSLARSEAKISYSKIATECDIKPNRVGELARGQGSVTTFEKIARIADALRIPGHMLGLAPRGWEAGAPDAGQREGDVHRRQFVKAAMGGGLAAGLPALTRPSVGRRIRSDLPQRLRERTARLRRLDDILGGGDTYSVYASEYQYTKTIIRDYQHTHATRQGLLSVLAEQAQQAGWAAFDAGRAADAASLYKASHVAAVEAQDAALAGNALAFLAYQAVNRQDGMETAARSVQEAGPAAPSGVRALLNERLAWAYAVAGHGSECEGALEAAEAALAEADGTPQPDWAAWVDATELQIMAGRCWTELRRPLRAVPVLTGALKSYADAHARDKSLYLSRLATSYLHAGEVEEAAKLASRALDLSAEVASVRPRQRLTPLIEQLRPYHRLSAVADALERGGAA